jgi:hypothetical protein
MVAYRALRPLLKSGDLVLTSGQTVFSRAIRFLTRSQWSHVGMVICADEWDMVLLWESTIGSTIPDVELARLKRGVQLVPLSERVRTYPGRFAVRSLSRPLTGDESDILRGFRRSYHDRDYDYDAAELLRSAIDIRMLGDQREDLSSFFCSELIAETYQALGFLGEGKPSNEYVPHDFSSQGSLALEKGVQFGPETIVTWD